MSNDATPTTAERLATSVQYLKHVGPKRMEPLAKLGLRTAAQVLFQFPRGYRDLGEIRAVADFEEGIACSMVGTITEVDLRNTGPGRSILGVLVTDGVGFVRNLWFNQPYMSRRFSVGSRVLLAGEPKLSGNRWEMTHPRVEYLQPDEEPSGGQILPVYPLTEGISQHQMRRIVRSVVDEYAEMLEEALPDSFREEKELVGIVEAMQQAHFPESEEQKEAAIHRLKYQELLVMQLALAIRRHRLTLARKAPPLEATAKIDARILRLFPFDLTDDQKQAITEVAADMAQPTPMNRLLQGDVGSGKTVVAMYAMLLTVAHEKQAAMMAPTEVLARQHFETLSKSLKKGRVRLVLLTGSLTAAQRRDALAQIEAGEVDLVVGTHAVSNAIANDQVKFSRLGLVIIDEQHKFGVHQRAAMKKGDLDPHYLVMTATPIPRTTAMTLFGDLDVSTIRQSPPGRQEVKTYIPTADQREKWWSFFRKKLQEGRQGYIVTPLVEASETTDLASAEQRFESLQKNELAGFRLDLIHGRMSAEAKAEVMQRFRAGETNALVTTSVIEVGIDVPNATLMTIEDGQRFGLSQLHQLRGRISRGPYPGFLAVFADTTTEEAEKRLEALESTTDGFALAEIDYELRGPGDLMGSRQHGLPPLFLANLSTDAELLDTARADARQLIAEDPELSQPEWATLRAMIFRRYGAAFELGDVG